MKDYLLAVLPGMNQRKLPKSLSSPRPAGRPLAPDLGWSDGYAALAAGKATSEILTVLEVANALRCSKAHVHNLIGGRVHGLSPLPAIRLGRCSRVRKETLQEWLEPNETRVAMIRSSPEIDAVDA